MPVSADTRSTRASISTILPRGTQTSSLTLMRYASLSAARSCAALPTRAAFGRLGGAEHVDRAELVARKADRFHLCGHRIGRAVDFDEHDRASPDR